MTLWALVACLPETFTRAHDMHDLERECVDRAVEVTLATKYWREWYTDADPDCGFLPAHIATYDHRCVDYWTCPDKAPLITDDPYFTATEDDYYACIDRGNSSEGWPDCPAPVLERWP